jgi:hypothetical protein
MDTTHPKTTSRAQIHIMVGFQNQYQTRNDTLDLVVDKRRLEWLGHVIIRGQSAVVEAETNW